MLRCLLLILVSAATAAAQFQTFHWTCKAEDGKFIRGMNNEKY